MDCILLAAYASKSHDGKDEDDNGWLLLMFHISGEEEDDDEDDDGQVHLFMREMPLDRSRL